MCEAPAIFNAFVMIQRKFFNKNWKSLFMLLASSVLRRKLDNSEKRLQTASDITRTNDNACSKFEKLSRLRHLSISFKLTANICSDLLRLISIFMQNFDWESSTFMCLQNGRRSNCGRTTLFARNYERRKRFRVCERHHVYVFDAKNFAFCIRLLGARIFVTKQELYCLFMAF